MNWKQYWNGLLQRRVCDSLLRSWECFTSVGHSLRVLGCCLSAWLPRSCSTLTYCSCRSDTRFRWDLPPSDLHFRQLSSSRCSDTRRFYRAMLCISAHYAAERCLSVCLSHAGIVSKRLNVFSDFLLWGSSMRHFSFFSYRTLWQYSDGTPPPCGQGWHENINDAYKRYTDGTPCLEKNCIFLSELRQIFMNFNNVWQMAKRLRLYAMYTFST